LDSVWPDGAFSVRLNAFVAVHLWQWSDVARMPFQALSMAAAAFAALPVTAFAAFPEPLAAHADQPGSHLRAEDHRVASVAYRLAIGGASFCTAPFPITGLLLHYLPEYDQAAQTAFIRDFGLDRGPGVLSVVAGSPAAHSGLRAGDVLLAIDGSTFPSQVAMTAERDRRRWRPMVERTEALIEDRLREGPVRLTVLREGGVFDITLSSRPGCAMRVRLARSRQNNAFADGRNVIMTTALLDFLESDDELAVVLAHELSHNLLGHRQQLREQRVPHGLLRGFGKNAARVRAAEEAADRLSVGLLWAAGYDLAAAPLLWRRYQARFGGQGLFRTHPGLAARERQWNETIIELRATEGEAPSSGRHIDLANPKDVTGGKER
jgi:hypothetical protein